MIISNQHWLSKPALLIFHFQIQNAPGTHRRTDSAAHARGSDNVLAPLRVPSDINAHLAVGGAIAAGNALSAIGGYPEARFKTLDDAEISGQRTTIPAPYPISHLSMKRNLDDCVNHVYNTPMVITTANTSTPCTIHRSIFQAFNDFCESCR
jgi:hypothetical protein